MTPKPFPTTCITSDRSRIETRQKCKRERFLGYHFNNTGIVKRGGKYEAEFGTILHKALREILITPESTIAPFVYELEEMVAVNFSHLQPGHLSHLQREQKWLFITLVLGWEKFRLPNILKEYTIISVEEETRVEFSPEIYLPANFAEICKPLVLPLRLDCLLRRKSDGLLHIMDFKTCSQASEDWNIGLDNSLQSNLYIEGVETHYGEPVGGIFYEGLVKGKREVDKAKSSSFNGQTIQYGSFLYGWQKNGTVGAYSSGAQRVFLPSLNEQIFHTLNLKVYGIDLENFFPNTIPWKPINSGAVVAQAIINENSFSHDVEMYESAPKGGALRTVYENLLFEQTLSNCYKYGSRHPCQFVNICRNKISQDEIDNQYEPREDHHKEQN